jgi:hypothetical protein
LFVTENTHLWFEFWYLSPISVIILPTRFIGGKPGQYNEITDKNLIIRFNWNLIEVVTKEGLTVT